MNINKTDEKCKTCKWFVNKEKIDFTFDICDIKARAIFRCRSANCKSFQVKQVTEEPK